MSNLEASRILESALKDVDAILKVNEINSPEANITENNNFDNHHLPEVPHLDVTDLNTDIVSYEHEFSVLIDRLQNCIDKLNHPGPVNASQVTGYGNLDYGITRDHRIRLVRPVTTQITELELSGICKSPPLQSSYSSNGGAVLSDEHFQQRILRLQAQIKAQANLIAKLEKDVNVVPPSKSTCINNNSNRGSHLSINMNNLELLTEVSKQHLRISSLEETNRDLEEKINKLEKELSQRSGYNHLKTSCEDIQSMKFNRQFIGQLPGSCRSIAAGNNNHTNKLNGSLRQLNSVNKVNYSSLRCSANPVVLNDTRFTTALQPEFNSNFVCYSMNGTQSTPPTSRLMYYNPYSYDNCLQSEDMNPNFYPTNHNQLPVIPNQIRSFSLNELRHSRIIQPIGQNNNNNNMRPSVRWDAHNHSGVKSSLTSGQHTYPLRENCHPNTQATAISHLPPQYASSYHQKSYAASRIRSPQPPIQPQTQPTQWIDQRNIFHNNGKQTLTAFSSNEQVSVSSVPCLPCDSPASVKCSTSENVYSSNTPRNHRISSPHLMNSVTHAQQFNEIPQDLGCFLQDDKLTIPAKSASGNHHRLKRIFTDRQYEKGWRSIALLPSPSLTDVFHWLSSNGQINKNNSNNNNNIINCTSVGLIKSKTLSMNQSQSGLINSSLSVSTRSKSMDRYTDGMKISTTHDDTGILPRRRYNMHTTPTTTTTTTTTSTPNGCHSNMTSTTTTRNDNKNNSTDRMFSSSSSIILNHHHHQPVNTLRNNNILQVTCHESISESSSRNNSFDRNTVITTDNNNISSSSNSTSINSCNHFQKFSEVDQHNKKRLLSPTIPAMCLDLYKSHRKLDNDKPTSSYTDSSISSSGGDQCQSFRFAYTKRNFCLWDKNMISAWLYRIGLGYTVSNTRRWLNTGQDLVTVSKKSLAQLMGIRNPLHLKKLSIHIHRCMKESSLNNHASLYRSIEAPENFDMTGWLHDIGLSAYIPQFDSCIIDPYVLDQLSMDDLSVLKMSNELHVLSLRWGIQMLRHISFDRNRLCRDHMQQCTANILINRNLLNSPKQSFPTTTDNMKLNSELNGVNHSGMNNAPSINTTITNGNNNNLISGLNASSRPNSVNHETEVFISTYLPIQICYWTQQRVLDWLQSIELPEYAPKLFGSGVHGALMIFEDRFTPDLLADILQISPVKSLVRRHLTHKFIELVGPEIWKRKQENEVNNSLTLNSKIKPSKKKSLFHSTRGHKGNDEVEELVCPVEIDPNHMSIFADEVELNCQIDCNQQLDQESTTAINLNSTNSQPLELQETDI
uniref:SAM domain-containing protein n=1 Tax=Trichobilharzia regenti TaxID=157069 RepID=A0AA85KHG4_TRIRE|nr:unnamed protein product [Trichobilharzia regenti]